MLTKEVLKGLKVGSDNIYGYDFFNQEQNEEMTLRKKVACDDNSDYLDIISDHHSIPVMDREVKLFLKKIPEHGIIIDVGGCWGWHWRGIEDIRPDVSIFIVDFIRENLVHAAKVLARQLNKNVFLIHGDATSLIFEDNVFDGYWSVQTLQHIPSFIKAVKEARRVLKYGGVFASYSLNKSLLMKTLYRILGKSYHIKGVVPDMFYLARASTEQAIAIAEIFSNKVIKRYSEVLFQPEIKINFPGKERSIIGRIDSMLSANNNIFSLLARQQSYHTVKV